MNRQKIDFIAYIYILLLIIYNLWNKTVLYLRCKHINGYVGK